MRGRDASILVVVVVLASIFAYSITVLPENARAAILYVGGSGPGNYTTIQEAINLSNPGDSVFVYHGTYNEEIVIDKTLTLEGESTTNTTIAAGPLDVIVVMADRVNITGFTIRPLGIDPDIPIGIALFSAEYCHIHQNIFEPSSWAGLGIRLSSSGHNIISYNHFANGSVGVYMASSHNNTFQDNTFVDMMGGFYVYASDNNVLSNNTIQASWYSVELINSVANTLLGNVMTEGGVTVSGILLEYWNTHTIDKTNIVNGKPVYYRKNATGGTLAAGGGQVILANTTGVVVENHDISNVYTGMQIGFSSHNYIANNTVRYTRTTGMSVYHSENNTIRGNDVSFNRHGLRLSSSNSNTVEFNTLTSNDEDGIYVYGFYNIITNNTISGNGRSIEVYRGEHNIVTNNTLFSNDYGIHLSQTRLNTVSGNNASGNSLCGIRIGQSEWNVVENNTLYMNSLDGFIVSNSENNSIDRNVVSYSLRNGVWIYSSFNNLFFHNSFIENALQAIDENGLNFWDNGYPSGGNFWSDYAGKDEKSGPNQDQPGSDGIGDMPYVIDADSRDRYPLISPFVIGPARAPSVTKVYLSGTGFVDVTIAWSLSPDDGAGYNNVVSYEVFRGLAYDPDGVGYNLLASVPNGTSQYVDASAGEGEPNDYYYRVCVTDSDNRSSCASAQGGKFTRSLSTGMNLVSIPLVQANESIDVVFQTVQWQNACGYNESFELWLCHDKSKGMRELNTISHTHSYWMNITQDSNLTVAGLVPVFTKIPLCKGWNLVGYPSFNTTYTVGYLKAVTGAVRVEGFDPSSPPYYLRKLEDWEMLEPGCGYWVQMTTYFTWFVRNP